VKDLEFVSVEDALRDGVDVVALFGGSVSVNNDFVRDVSLDAYVKVENYHIPYVVLDVFREGGNIYNDIILTRIEKSFDPLERWKIKRALKPWEDNKKFTCGTYSRKTCVECRGEYIIKHPCKTEWCPDCGTPGSLYHMGNYVKVLFYAFQMWLNVGSVGYFVVTSPSEVREDWKDKRVLSAVASGVRQIMQKVGFDYGFWRWHFAGDKGIFYPHLNVLVPWGYIEEGRLQQIKDLIVRELGIKVVHYQYARDLERVKHMVYYITRPTWNLQSELDPSEWKGFRKQNIWGPKYFSKDEDLKNLFYEVMFKKGRGNFVGGGNVGEFEIEDDLFFLLSLQKSKCPVCGRELRGGYFRGYGGKWLKGNVFRLGWHLWMYAPKRRKKSKKEVRYEEVE